MNTIASPFMNLSAVILGLRVAVAGWGGRRLLDAALVHLVHFRLGEVLRRIAGMVARFEAGRVRRVPVRGAGEPGLAGAVRPRRADGVRLWPGRFAWLVRDVGWEAAGVGSQLRAVLETPEMVAFLAACPEAARLLRPVCRMLAIETQVLRPGVACDAGPVRDARVRARVRAPVETLDLGRVPIPRGVMGWVRRDCSAKG